MSKNVELFINVCNFMKYLLNDILPDCEPTDIVKDAIEELQLVLIKYSHKINVDIPTVFDKNEDILNISENLSHTNLADVSRPPVINYTNGFLEEEMLVDFSYQQQDCKVVKSRLRNNVNSLDSNFPEDIIDKTAPLKHEDKLGKITEQNVSNFNFASKKKGSDSALTQEENGSNLQSIHDTSCSDLKLACEKKVSHPELIPNDSGNQPVIFNQVALKMDHELSLKKDFEIFEAEDSSNKSLKTKKKILDDSNLNFFDDCFLKQIFIQDSFILTDVNYSDEGHIPLHLKKPNILCANSEAALHFNAQSVPENFIDLNRCLMNKLVASVLYCWDCGKCVGKMKTLMDHLGFHQKFTIETNVNFKLVTICSSCSFFAVVPQSMTKILMKYHQSHHSLVTRNINRSKIDNVLYVKNVLKVRPQTSHFWGICLLCHVYFTSPLEWTVHVDEFRHLKIPREIIIHCKPCCLVILCNRDEFRLAEFLKLEEHVSCCRLRLLN